MNTFNEICARHTLGVARYMYEHAKDYKLNAENMFLLGWTHDIGLVLEHDNHEKRGGTTSSCENININFKIIYIKYRSNIDLPIRKRKEVRVVNAGIDQRSISDQIVWTYFRIYNI